MKVEAVINSVNNLSPSSRILPKLQKVIRNDMATVREIIQLIKVDANITAQVLRLSNSAYYAPAQPNTSLESAIECLGFQEIYKLVGILSSQDLFSDKVPLYNLKEGELWKISIISAHAMDYLAKLSDFPRDTAYTAGLLNCIGKVAINRYSLEQGLEIFSLREMGNKLPLREKAVFGFTQAEIGAKLLRKWNFPELIHQGIEYQFEPWESIYEDKRLAQLLHLNNWVVANIEPESENDRIINENFRQIMETLNITVEELEDTRIAALEGLNAVHSMIS